MVTMDAGTGIVHIAPGHGDVDNKLGKHYNLPEVSPVDEKGEFEESTGEFKGLYVKDADKKIITKLENTNKTNKSNTQCTSARKTRFSKQTC